jgi:hypothetical protein
MLKLSASLIVGVTVRREKPLDFSRPETGLPSPPEKATC